MAGEVGRRPFPAVRRGVWVNNKEFTTISKGDRNDDTTKTRATKRARVTKRARATRAMVEPSPREK